MSSLLATFARAVMAAVALVATTAANGQSYPSKPIRIVIPYPPGGLADVNARILAGRLGEELGVPVLVESRPGAGGTLAMQYVANSPPDGYMLVQSNPGPSAIALALYKTPGYTNQDFSPVSTFVTSEMFMVVRADSSRRSAKDFAALDKSQPGNYGSSGMGAPSHLAGTLFNLASGTKFEHVPYKGAVPLSTALLTGEVDWAFLPGTDAISQVRAGKMRAIAVASLERSPLLPGTPTLAELGISGLDLGLWYGILAPAKTPKDIVDLLNQKIGKILNEPETRKRLLALNVVPSPITPRAFEELIRSEVEKYTRAVQLSGVRIE